MIKIFGRIAFLWLLGASAIFASPEIRDGWWNGKPWDLEKLAAQVDAGSPAALAEWAYGSAEGRLPFDEELIFRRALQAAERGDPLGQAVVSRNYFRGIGTDADFAKAVEYARLSIKNGHPLGEKELSATYLWGGAAERDREEGNRLVEKSGAAGCRIARFNIAISHFEGYTRKRNLKVSLELAKEALADTHPNFYQGMLVLMHDERQSGEISGELRSQAEALVREAADNDQPDAKGYLAWRMISGGDFDAGLPMLIEAANAGSYQALDRMLALAGESHRRGNVVHAERLTRGKIALEAVRRGRIRQGTALLAGWYLTLEERYAEARPILREALRLGREDAAKWLAISYVRDPEARDVDRSVALWIYQASHDPSAIYSLAYYASGKVPEAQNPPIAYAASVEGLKRIKSREHLESLEKWRKETWERCTPEQREEATRLVEAGYPSGDVFQQEARKLLIASGDLPPDAE